MADRNETLHGQREHKDGFQVRLLSGDADFIGTEALAFRYLRWQVNGGRAKRSLFVLAPTDKPVAVKLDGVLTPLVPFYTDPKISRSVTEVQIRSKQTSIRVGGCPFDVEHDGLGVLLKTGALDIKEDLLIEVSDPDILVKQRAAIDAIKQAARAAKSSPAQGV